MLPKLNVAGSYTKVWMVQLPALKPANDGELAVATSTSGWGYSLPGRIGDSPVAGAGFYADSRYGAAACTHTGEMAIRTAASRIVVYQMSRGASVKDACLEAKKDIESLKEGYLGTVVIHAIDNKDEHFVCTAGHRIETKYCIWQEGDKDFRMPFAEQFPKTL